MVRKRTKNSKPRFNLEGPPNGRKLQPIYLIYRYKKDSDGKNVMLKYSTGLKSYRSTWLQGTQRVKPSLLLPEPDAKNINAKLRIIEDTVNQAVAADRQISVDNLKNELDFELGYKSRPKSKMDCTLLDYVRKYIDRSDRHLRTIQKYEMVQCAFVPRSGFCAHSIRLY